MILAFRRWRNWLRTGEPAYKPQSEFTRVMQALAIINQNVEDMQMDITRLTREVEETRGAIDSAVKLIKETANAIRQYKTDQVALEKLADDLDASQNALASAIVEANTAPADGENETNQGGQEPAGENTDNEFDQR